MYGRTALISNIISKARERVKSHFSLSGDTEKVRKEIEWLLTDAHFMYGEINLVVCVYCCNDLCDGSITKSGYRSES